MVAGAEGPKKLEEKNKRAKINKKTVVRKEKMPGALHMECCLRTRMPCVRWLTCVRCLTTLVVML